MAPPLAQSQQTAQVPPVSTPSWWLAPAAFLIILGFLKLWDLYTVWRFPSSETAQSVPLKDAMAMRGQYGDQFGGINAVIQAAILALLLSDRRVQRTRNAEQDEQHRRAEELQRKEIEQLTERNHRDEERAARLEKLSGRAYRDSAQLQAIAAQVNAKTAVFGFLHLLHDDYMSMLTGPHHTPDKKKDLKETVKTNFRDIGEVVEGLMKTVNDLESKIETFSDS
jgi:hypothetical protein